MLLHTERIMRANRRPQTANESRTTIDDVEPLECMLDVSTFQPVITMIRAAILDHAWYIATSVGVGKKINTLRASLLQCENAIETVYRRRERPDDECVSPTVGTSPNLRHRRSSRIASPRAFTQCTAREASERQKQ